MFDLRFTRLDPEPTCSRSWKADSSTRCVTNAISGDFRGFRAFNGDLQKTKHHLRISGREYPHPFSIDSLIWCAS
jgi:hypothetical protein